MGIFLYIKHMNRLNNYSASNDGNGKESKEMMKLQVFNNELFGSIRVVVVDNEPYFVGRDVAIALGYAKPENAIPQHVDKEDTLKQGIPDGQGFMQNTTIINESGLYSLIFGSKLPLAKNFKRWVTSDVLPSIRKTGGYIHSTTEDTPELIMARALQVAQATIENHQRLIHALEEDNGKLSKENEVLAPKAKYTDEVLMSETTYTMTQVAKEFGMGANAFSDFLFKKKVLYRQSGMWMMFAKYDDKGYSAVRTKKIENGKGSVITSSYLVWTEKGRMFLHNKFDRELNVDQQLNIFD